MFLFAPFLTLSLHVRDMAPKCRQAFYLIKLCGLLSLSRPRLPVFNSSVCRDPQMMMMMIMVMVMMFLVVGIELMHVWQIEKGATSTTSRMESSNYL